MPSRAPFDQLPFDAVPEAPRVPHGYAQTEAFTVPIAWPAPGATTSVHVRVMGRGPPLLLVHGFMTSSYSWRYVIADLARDFTVYAPDLPGAGRSDKPDTSYAPDALAAAIGATIDALGIRGAPVVGNSLGGYLAMRLALADPGAMGRLVNLHSPGVPTGRMWALFAALRLLPGAATIVRRLVWRDPERWVHQNVHYFDETLKSKEEHREYAAPLRTPEGVAAFHRMLRETMDPRAMRAFVKSLADLEGRFPIPLMLVYARRDPMVPPAVGAALRRLLPAATFVELARGSHFAHVDAPDLFLETVGPFLRAAPHDR
ncbi:MAG: alpha/beta hydrolase [Deltaproteobacteria bacterium]|nr:alpha/beta hydrolase [Deltaproteobacteria bacterium]